MTEVARYFGYGAPAHFLLPTPHYPNSSMPDNPQADVTRLLVQLSTGDQTAINHLMPLVYDELRRIAGAHLRRERAGHTLQSTALVHEAYLRLIDQHNVVWQNRAHFFGLA